MPGMQAREGPEKADDQSRGVQVENSGCHCRMLRISRSGEPE